MANRSGKLAQWEGNQGVQERPITLPILFKSQPGVQERSITLPILFKSQPGVQERSIPLPIHFKSQPGATAPGPRQTSKLQQWTSRFNVVDKQSGSYIRSSVRESSSNGDVFKERSTGRVGFNAEQKKTSTFKLGDKGGYSEYQIEERFRNISFDDGNKTSSGQGTNSKLVNESEGSYVNSPDERYNEDVYDDDEYNDEDGYCNGGCCDDKDEEETEESDVDLESSDEVEDDASIDGEDGASEFGYDIYSVNCDDDDDDDDFSYDEDGDEDDPYYY